MIMAMLNAALLMDQTLSLLQWPHLVVETFGNVGTGSRGSEALIRCHPHTTSPSRTIALLLNSKEGIYQSLFVG
jgi:hypothetical protein